MLTHERKAYLMKRLAIDERLVAKDISQELDLSLDTVRRDLRELAADGLLQRVHGGALPLSPAVVDLGRRRSIATDGKAAIGRKAASMLTSGRVVFIDGGTSTGQLVRYLPIDLEATIVTHSPTIAAALVEHRGLTVELIGGRLFRHSMVTVGAAALKAIERYRPDCCFLGVTGIEPDAGLTTGDAEEALIKRAIIQQSGEVIVLASAEKLGAASPFLIAPMSEVDTIVAERSMAPDQIAAFGAKGCAVVLVN